MRRITGWAICGACLVAWATGGKPSAGGEKPSSRRTNDLRRQLQADLADGQLEQFSLLEGALLASGIDSPAELERARRSFQKVVRAATVATSATNDRSLVSAQGPSLYEQAGSRPPHAHPPGDPSQALALLDCLHREVLTGEYRAECTEVHHTLERGDFNCVTASVLYLELARAAGFKCQAVAAPGHVMVRIMAPQSLDVQTTQPAQGELASAPANRVVPAGKGRQLSDAALIGKVYYNRAVSALEQRQFEEAIALTRLSLACDSADELAAQNLLAALNNRALQLADAGEFAAAAARLDEARQLNANWPLLAVNDVYVHHRWAVALCGKGEVEAGLKLLAECQARYPLHSNLAAALAALRQSYRPGG